MNFLWVALGGAVGAVGRYAVSLLPLKTAFPWLTFLTNVLGAVLIGFIAGAVSGREEVPPSAVLFWKTGVCGGFTTFSTFSLEACDLFEKGAYGVGAAYVTASLLCCLAGVFCGKRLALLLC